MLQLIVDSVDSIPEAHRPLYEERDGKFHLAVEGLEDTSGLKSALQKERETAKTVRQALKNLEEQFSGIDPVKVRDMMSKLDADGESALIAAGKIDEVIAKRTEKLKTELQKQVDDAAKQVEKERGKTNKFSQRVLDNNIRAAAAKAGLHSHAIEDALLRARSMFTVDEDGNAVQLDEDYIVVLGKDGKTPYSPLEWLEGMIDKAPHWFPAGMSGGSAPGGKDPNPSGKRTMKRSQFNALSPVEQSSTSKTHKIID